MSSNLLCLYKSIEEKFDEVEALRKWIKFDGIMAWFIITEAMLVGLAIVVFAVLESSTVNQAGTHNRQVAFLGIAEFMGDMIGRRGGIRDLTKLQDVHHDVRNVRAGIKRLSVFGITPDSSSLLLSTDPKTVPQTFDLWERSEIQGTEFTVDLPIWDGAQSPKEPQ